MAVTSNLCHLPPAVADSQIRTPFCCWLQGYQSFTQALGVLELKEARDAFLSSLCSFALSSKMAEDADLDLPMSPASVSSPSGASEDADCCSVMRRFTL